MKSTCEQIEVVRTQANKQFANSNVDVFVVKDHDLVVFVGYHSFTEIRIHCLVEKQQLCDVECCTGKVSV